MKRYHPCFDQLIEHLLAFLPNIDPRFSDLLRPLLTAPFTVKDDLLILKPGDIADYAFWPVEGFIRSYRKYKPDEDREYYEQKTTSISSPEKISLCSNSYMNRKPVDFYVEIPKGSTMVAFSHTAFQIIGSKIPQVATLALNILSDAEDDWQKRVEICQVKGLEGYRTFLDAFTEVESFIYLKHIASCIGMSPEHLSRIRKEGGFGDDHLRR
ncbi:MAG TPA: hypothetical protein VK541_24835 [Pedobacter sp.]|uniref:Crp/Fnr family transcriptional regulator n=1 Tax=Pedobacter sp. TaxID=1411316 RepID=UPI002CD1DCEA|nr:hypothetical protein [Pedobacter sp.]HMI05738.1 hypothetical protein [Pedobacter sp.]